MKVCRSNVAGPVLALATACLATSALAQAPHPRPTSPDQEHAQPSDMAMTIAGQLESVNATTRTLVVKTADGKSESLRYDDATKVIGGRSGVAGLANAKGTQVIVKYRGTGTDRVASEITIHDQQ
ncbi:MAG: hypothetical protein AB7O28_02030 [Vicinamibacterales bacterium]